MEDTSDVAWVAVSTDIAALGVMRAMLLATTGPQGVLAAESTMATLAVATAMVASGAAVPAAPAE